MGVLVALLVAPGLAGARLMRSNNTPFASSSFITGASWVGPRYGPPHNQSGDILPTVWAHDGNQYTVMDDGGTSEPGGEVWKQSLAQITGTPPKIHFRHVGDPNDPPPHTYAEIHKNKALWDGPLGPYYSSGLVAANHVLYATQEDDWDWNANSSFEGLKGIAYSRDRGQHWVSANKAFRAPLGNLTRELPYWVIRDGAVVLRDGSYRLGFEVTLPGTEVWDAVQLARSNDRLRTLLNTAVPEGECLRVLVEVHADYTALLRVYAENCSSPHPIVRELHRRRLAALSNAHAAGHLINYRVLFDLSLDVQLPEVDPSLVAVEVVDERAYAALEV